MPTYTITVSDADQKALDNDLLDTQDWLDGAAAGKINECKKRMAKTASDVLKADSAVTTMPADDDELIAAYIDHKDYPGNRVDRDAMEAS